MKICIVSETYIGHPKASGGQIGVHSLAKELVKRKYEVHILTSLYKGGIGEEIKDGVNIHRLFLNKYGMCNQKKGWKFILYKNELFYIHSKNILNKFIATNKIDILHSYNTTSLYAVSKVAKKHNIPAAATISSQDLTCPQQVLHIRKGEFCNKCGFKKMFGCRGGKNMMRHILLTIYNYYLFLLQRYCVKKIDNIFTTCDDLKQRLEKNKIKVKDVIYNIAHDMSGGNAEIFKKQFEINSQFVLFIASFLSDKSKGYDTFIEVARLCPEITFVCLAKKDIASVPLKNVIYVERVDQETLSNIYSAASVVLIPSSVPDALPIVGLEALTAGKPIIGTNIGGIPEIIEEETNGHLINMKENAAFAIKIKKIMNSPSLQQKFSEASKKIFENKFNTDLTVSRITKYYEELRKEKLTCCDHI